jgi:pimeloyl-ACP methyl ester carboxylesterase
MVAFAAEDAAAPVSDDRPRPPSIFWTLMEGRAAFELGAFYSLRLLMRHLPKGDGHPVIVLPGFVASDISTRPLRAVLKELGYPAYGWGLGRNLKFNDEREAQMRALLDKVFAENRRKVSIVGWSLGGVFARELAKRAPDKVRSVISLGSPITAHRDYSNARRLYDAINGAPEAHRAEQLAQLGQAPPAPTTSIFSKTDGVVAWRGSLQRREHGHERIENIEVPASHFGLGVNPLVIYAIADRLAQPESDWKPFDGSGFRRAFFRRHEA